MGIDAVYCTGSESSEVHYGDFSIKDVTNTEVLVSYGATDMTEELVKDIDAVTWYIQNCCDNGISEPAI